MTCQRASVCGADRADVVAEPHSAPAPVQLRNEAADSIDRAARAEYAPTGRANWDGSTTLFMADQVRSRALETTRNDLRSGAQARMGNHLRGAFAELGDRLPAAELILLEKGVPFKRVRTLVIWMRSV